MGPDDSYLLQYNPDVDTFWADPRSLALGAIFRTGDSLAGSRGRKALKRLMDASEFDASVSEGYQASTSWHQGEWPFYLEFSIIKACGTVLQL